jgi:hypothetical protein
MLSSEEVESPQLEAGLASLLQQQPSGAPLQPTAGQVRLPSTLIVRTKHMQQGGSHVLGGERQADPAGHTPAAYHSNCAHELQQQHTCEVCLQRCTAASWQTDQQ